MPKTDKEHFELIQSKAYKNLTDYHKSTIKSPATRTDQDRQFREDFIHGIVSQIWTKSYFTEDRKKHIVRALIVLSNSLGVQALLNIKNVPRFCEEHKARIEEILVTQALPAILKAKCATLLAPPQWTKDSRKERRMILQNEGMIIFWLWYSARPTLEINADIIDDLRHKFPTHSFIATDIFSLFLQYAPRGTPLTEYGRIARDFPSALKDRINHITPELARRLHCEMKRRTTSSASETSVETQESRVTSITSPNMSEGESDDGYPSLGDMISTEGLRLDSLNAARVLSGPLSGPPIERRKPETLRLARHGPLQSNPTGLTDSVSPTSDDDDLCRQGLYNEITRVITWDDECLFDIALEDELGLMEKEREKAESERADRQSQFDGLYREFAELRRRLITQEAYNAPAQEISALIRMVSMYKGTKGSPMPALGNRDTVNRQMNDLSVKRNQMAHGNPPEGGSKGLLKDYNAVKFYQEEYKHDRSLTGATAVVFEQLYGIKHQDAEPIVCTEAGNLRTPFNFVLDEACSDLFTTLFQVRSHAFSEVLLGGEGESELCMKKAWSAHFEKYSEDVFGTGINNPHRSDYFSSTNRNTQDLSKLVGARAQFQQLCKRHKSGAHLEPASFNKAIVKKNHPVRGSEYQFASDVALREFFSHAWSAVQAFLVDARAAIDVRRRLLDKYLKESNTHEINCGASDLIGFGNFVDKLREAKPGRVGPNLQPPALDDIKHILIVISYYHHCCWQPLVVWLNQNRKNWHDKGMAPTSYNKDHFSTQAKKCADVQFAHWPISWADDA